MSSILDRALGGGHARKLKSHEKRVVLIGAFEGELEQDTDVELRERMGALRGRAAGGESLDALLAECFGVVRETAKRCMGMRHFDVQLIGGMALHEGQIAEMKTGEGKTLTATLAVVLNSLAGQGVHVVTVNDYLARRDAQWMGPIYRALGVSVGALQEGQSEQEKQSAYAADVTYGTNSEFGFDYLRDNLAIEASERVQRDHAFAVVDEVDNILIDEARTPLEISGEEEQNASELQARLAELAREMVAGRASHGGGSVDYEFDRKHKTVAVTEQGVAKAERFLGIGHLYTPENGPLVNHLIQALKAESLYKRDVDYTVIDREVKIIDEFTGRVEEDRRWSEGLHQAVEAKEGLDIRAEERIEATVTYQNYFRLYQKLSGMTGTASTDATEFSKTYGLEVLEIPTNVPARRVDDPDEVYATKEGKWNAVVKEIVSRHENGQPVLVGTISVEVSELLGERLKRQGVAHTVLNAKPEHAAREAEIVAEAGQPGAVTIATNMAGRGVDIKLGGNAEHLAESELARRGVEPGSEEYEHRYAELLPAVQAQVQADRERVVAAGGLFICGTERHESRRIDNQLRGRSGRQGDPGESTFYLSLEDDLIQNYGEDGIQDVIEHHDDESHPIVAKSVAKEIEKAQRKIEKENFLTRKSVLEYDDVMNEQRRIIYAYRDQVLEGREIGEEARKQIAQVLASVVDQYTSSEDIEEWDPDGMSIALSQFLPDIDIQPAEPQELVAQLTMVALERYEEIERRLGKGAMGELERSLLLATIDECWPEHLSDMEYLQEGIHLRGFAEEDPLVAYKNEGFDLFDDLINAIWSDFTRMIFNVSPSSGD